MRAKVVIGTAFAVLVGWASAPAGAQGVSGTIIGAPNPGRFAINSEIGFLALQMPRFRYGDAYILPFSISPPLTPSNGAIFDERNHQGAIAPSLSFGWGLPNGLFGQRAELFGEFDFARATESATYPGLPGNSPAVLTMPFVNVSTGGVTGFSFVTPGSIQPSFSRSYNSYNGQIGARLHFPRGRWSFSPGAYVGMQRTDLDESVSISPIGTANFNLNSFVSSTYYQIGLSLGATYELTQPGPNPMGHWTLFAVLQGGLDYVRSQYTGSSNLTATLVIDDFFTTLNLPAAAADKDNRWSGRGSLRSGIAWSVTENFTLTLSMNMQYIGSVSNVVYPSHSTFSGSPLATNGTVPAHLDSQGQLNYGGGLGATWRF